MARDGSATVAVVLTRFSWILPGRLAGMAYPHAGAGRELAERGVRALLCLTDTRPSPEFADAGLVVGHEPIQDFTAPDAATLSRCVDFVLTRWKQGQAVAVHCVAGMGRTGTVLAACLVATGMEAKAAIERIRAERPGSVETEGQEGAGPEFARREGKGRACGP